MHTPASCLFQTAFEVILNYHMALDDGLQEKFSRGCVMILRNSEILPKALQKVLICAGDPVMLGE